MSSAHLPYDPCSRYAKPVVQCFHDGQSYLDCPNFKCDFSTETSINGHPKSAVKAAWRAFTDVAHYPEQDAWPRCYFAAFLGLDPLEILFGNGASELIEILFRILPGTTTWRVGPWGSQYNEFLRCATSIGLPCLPPDDDSAGVTVLINPKARLATTSSSTGCAPICGAALH
jgi:histidinol-phosphate/aromatic aminotransferase/cobyric acid decarboxylase-like protein